MLKNYRKDSLRAKVLEFIAKNPNSSERDIIIGLDRVWHRHGHGLVYYDNTVNQVLHLLRSDKWISRDLKKNRVTGRTVASYSLTAPGTEQWNHLNRDKRGEPVLVGRGPDLVQVPTEFLIKAYKEATDDQKKRIMGAVECGANRFPFSTKVIEREAVRLMREDESAMSINLRATADDGNPVFVGKGWAPVNMALKCLMVKDGFEAKLTHYGGNQMIAFYPKQDEIQYTVETSHCMMHKSFVQKIYKEVCNDWKKLIKSAVPTAFEDEEKVYKCGTIFSDDSGEEFVLARLTSSTFALVSIFSGNRWTDPFSFTDAKNNLIPHSVLVKNIAGFEDIFTVKR